VKIVFPAIGVALTMWLIWLAADRKARKAKK
jgi:hypothetical protein